MSLRNTSSLHTTYLISVANLRPQYCAPVSRPGLGRGVFASCGSSSEGSQLLCPSRPRRVKHHVIVHVRGTVPLGCIELHGPGQFRRLCHHHACVPGSSLSEQLGAWNRSVRHATAWAAFARGSKQREASVVLIWFWIVNLSYEGYNIELALIVVICHATPRIPKNASNFLYPETPCRCSCRKKTPWNARK